MAPTLATPPAYSRESPFGDGDGPWWAGFADPVLDDLIDDGLDQNLQVAIAEARLIEARSLLRAETSDLFPRLDGFADGTVSTGLTGDGADSVEAATGGLAFAWLPDLFGGSRRERQAARANAAAFAFSLVDVQRIIADQIASTYVELRRTDARLTLLETSLELQNRTLEIVRLRASAGLGADLDVQRALADLAQTRAQRGPLIAARTSADTSLSVLIGSAPDRQLVLADDDGTIPSYTDGPTTGIPADLLRRRPDLRAAEAQVVQSIALVGAEIADLYPALSLPGSLSVDLTESNIADSAVAALSALIDIPLFDAGRRRAEVRAAEARADAAIADYRLTLLGALREVELALTQIETTRQRRDDLAIAVEASEAAFSQLQSLYTEGLATLIEVLDAQRQLINSREAFVDSEAELAAAVIALYRAAGFPSEVDTTSSAS